MDFTQLFVYIFGKLARNHGIADLIITSRILSGLQDSPGFRGMKSSAVDIGLSSPKTPRSTSKRSSMIQSGPTTPKTPRSLSKRALVFTREDSPLKMTFVAVDKEGNNTI